MKKLFWFFVLVVAIAFLLMILYIGNVAGAQGAMNDGFAWLVATAAGVHYAIVTSWVWQNIFLPYGFFPIGTIIGFVGATLLAIKVNGWWHKFRLSQIRQAQRQAGLQPMVMPTAPAMVAPTVVSSAPTVLQPEPEKKNQ